MTTDFWLFLLTVVVAWVGLTIRRQLKRVAENLPAAGRVVGETETASPVANSQRAPEALVDEVRHLNDAVEALVDEVRHIRMDLVDLLTPTELAGPVVEIQGYSGRLSLVFRPDGETVSRGDALVEIDVDGIATQTVKAPVAGILHYVVHRGERCHA